LLLPLPDGAPEEDQLRCCRPETCKHDAAAYVTVLQGNLLLLAAAAAAVPAGAAAAVGRLLLCALALL
jgi:hypothetical protein